ncbi:hypothetical protein Hrd1104_06300 [Halorhabdus sp. CBA1104]|uniref:hypothetical protein n=1 Tax=Halorhabdus sp. CBA1104 TaxID=1380432 RepID=UPI0012B1905F|nr:hypothetical protein [Halorhabdus sp. CBA1104]QGN06943.1 hypothetical protein Hrd1104_06300 [Halorhabdus sp. CBA1104]
MAAPPDVVLVYAPDETKRRSITTALRDRWSVRTATTPEAAASSLDETIAVVVGTDGTSIEDPRTNSPSECDHIQLLWLASSEAEVPASGGNVLADDVSADALRQTVARLHRRARYDRLLTTCYELSRARSEAKADESASAEDIAAGDRELESVQRDLDELTAELNDVEAFDVALDE